MKSIQDRLKTKNVKLEEFQAVNALLISRGFLSRDDGVRLGAGHAMDRAGGQAGGAAIARAGAGSRNGGQERQCRGHDGLGAISLT